MMKVDRTVQIAFEKIKGRRIYDDENHMFAVRIKKTLELSNLTQVKEVLNEHGCAKELWYKFGTISDRDIRADSLFISGLTGRILYFEGDFMGTCTTYMLDLTIMDIVNICDFKSKSYICPLFKKTIMALIS